MDSAVLHSQGFVTGRKQRSKEFLMRSPGYLTAGLFTEGNVININGSF